MVGGRRVASFRHQQHRVTTGLELLDGQRTIDVTVQPDTIVHLLRGLAGRNRRDGNAWERALARRLEDKAVDWGFEPANPAGEELAPLIASLGFPIIGLAAARGATPPPYVPRWAEPVLSAPDARAAARAAFGRSASRRVVRALPASFLGGDSEPAQHALISLMPLALAMSLPEQSSADLIANVLLADSADHAPQHWPDTDQLEALRRGFRLFGPDLSATLAAEALGSLPGPGRLIYLVVHVPMLFSSNDRRLPRRIDDLESDIADLVVTEMEVPPPPREVRAAAYHADRGIDLPVEPLYQPGPAAVVDVGEEFQYPERVLRLHGASFGLYSIALPRTRHELRGWGRQLDNCMADYCDSVAASQSVVLGLRRDGRLVAGAELTGDLARVRQFVRDGNHPPWRAERDALRLLLTRLGVAGG